MSSVTIKTMLGLFDNVEMDEICAISSSWEQHWFGGPNRGEPLAGEGEGRLAEAAALKDLAARLCARAR